MNACQGCHRARASCPCVFEMHRRLAKRAALNGAPFAVAYHVAEALRAAPAAVRLASLTAVAVGA